MINTENTILTNEEGYELTRKYVGSLLNKFYSLKDSYEVDDIVSEIYIKFLEKKFFEKYNPEVTSKKYFVMRAVQNSMIDMLRKHKETTSLDKEDEEGLRLMDRIASVEEIEESVVGENIYQQLMDALPDETRSKVVGDSPILGECKMTHRVVAIHLMQGFKVKDIAQMFINPNNKKPVTSGSISKIVKEIKEELTMGMAYLSLR